VTIGQRRGRSGVDVHLEPEECALFVQLVADAQRVDESELGSGGVYSHAAPSYLSLSLSLGKKIRELIEREPSTLTEGLHPRSLGRDRRANF
jgi:hypothetical protein